MPSYQINRGSAAYPLVFLMIDSADHVSPKAGLAPTVVLSKAGAAFAAPAGAVTEIANGWYQVAGNPADCSVLGPLLLHATAPGADPTDMLYEVVAHDVQDAVRLGLSALPGAAAGAAGGLPTGDAGGRVTVGTNTDKSGYSLTQAFPVNFAQMALDASGAVTAGTVADKAGYSLAQAFPANFAALAITAGGAVTVGTNTDKSGYSLTQAFPANFAQMALDAGGRVQVQSGTGTGQISLAAGKVTVGTNADKSGYSLAQAFPANFAALAITAGGAVTVGTNADKSGYSLAQAFPANFAQMALDASGAVTAGTVADKSGYSLAADGVDAVMVEAGANLRQATAVIFAAQAGVLSGATTPSVVIKGGGVDATRIQATVDGSGNRTAVLLSLPS